MLRTFVAFGAANAFLAVALGAFGAHGLRARLAPDMLAVYQTGAHYHLVHAVALVLVGIASERLPGSRLVAASGWLLFAGMLLFSGSLYALALTGLRPLGAITPFGGLAFLSGWACLFAAAVRARA